MIARPLVARRLLSGLALCLGWLLGGCAPNLYLTESEVAAFAANLKTAESAQTLFADLDGKVFDIRFAPAPGGGLAVQSSNTLAMLREMQRLRFIADAWQQIRLERLASQLDRQLSDWLVDQRSILERRSGSMVQITRIDRVTLGVVEPPVFTYDVASQSIRFELTVSSGVHGRMAHRIFGEDVISGLLSTLDSLFGASDVIEGENDVTLTIRDLRVTGVLAMSQPYRDASFVRLALDADAAAATVVVAGTAPPEIRSAARDVVIQNLAPTHRETHALLFDHFGITGLALEAGAPGPAELTYRYASRIEPARALVDVVVRGDDRRLYHSRRTDGVFSEAARIPLDPEIESDPAVVASSPGRLELLAVARDGDLVHASFRHGAWQQDWTASAGGIPQRFAKNSRIGLLATAPGQLEIVAAGDNGALLHLRRKNGAWRAPVAIDEVNQRAGGAALRDPLLVQVGFRLLLVCRDESRVLHAAVFDMESNLWSQASQLGSDLAHAPAAVLLDDWNVGVAYSNRSGELRYRRVNVFAASIRPGVATSGLGHGPEVVVGSGVNGPPVLASTGHDSAQLGVRGDDGKLKLNHLSGGVWSGWTAAGDAFFGTPSNGRIGAEFALAATADGQLHWVGKRGDRRSRVMYNQHPGYATTYPGPSFTSPQHWRGFQDVDHIRYHGRPAVAVTSRTAAVAVVDAGFIPWTAVIGDARPSTFVPSGQAVTFGTDPQVVRQHVGQIDLLYVGDTGQLRHSRRRHDAVQQSASSPPVVPAGVGTFAATGRANQLDVVVLGRNRSLYYMRHSAGAWQGLVGFGSDVISTPTVVDIGAGQLEIFAVDSSLRLNRWRLSGGQLTPGDVVISPVAVSGVLFGRGNAVGTGEGGVDLVVAENGSGELHHTRMLPGSTQPAHPAGLPGQPPFVFTGARVADHPALVAQSPRRVDAVVIDDRGMMRHGSYANTLREAVRLAPPLARDPALPVPGGPLPVPAAGLRVGSARWSDFGLVYDIPGLVAGATLLAEKELAVPVCSRSGNIWLSRYRDGRWLPLVPVFGNLPPVPTDRPCRVVTSAH